MSKDELETLARQTREAHNHLKAAIRKAQAKQVEAKTELDLLWTLDAMLMLDDTADLARALAQTKQGGEA